MSLISYKNPLVKGKEILLDQDFAKAVDQLVAIGTTYGITLFMNSGFRVNSNHLQGAVVTPAKKSNHFVGGAIDCNLIYNGKFFTSDYFESLIEKETVPEDVLSFIKEWKDMGYRWGGEPPFNPIDVVHFDNACYQKNPEKWTELYLLYHDNPAHNF